MQHYGISREDEVYIHTTSQSNYVSSCVTCTIFNYGKPSRVLTGNTKMIYVIHEFGYADNWIDTLLNDARNRGIPLVEDVAHSVNSFYKGRRLGTIGDYGLYSLPKFFNLSRGGLLLDNKKALGTRANQENGILDAFFENAGFINSITRRKQEIARLFANGLPQFHLSYEASEESAPFVFSIDFSEIEIARQIGGYFQDHFPMIDLFPTHVPGRIAFPINPFCDIPVYELIIEHLKAFKHQAIFKND